MSFLNPKLKLKLKLKIFLLNRSPGVIELGIAGAYHGGRGMQEGAGGGPGDAAQDKRDMQSEITFSMYAVRVAEMKVRLFTLVIRVSFHSDRVTSRIQPYRIIYGSSIKVHFTH